MDQSQVQRWTWQSHHGNGFYSATVFVVVVIMKMTTAIMP
jgi:hypothetical protein